MTHSPAIFDRIPQRLVIATRESRLALWQSQYIKQRLETLYPSCQVELLGLTTRGDRILDRPLAEVGGKGLFVKELEVAMLEGRADIAVHSMKDVPMALEAGFTLACITEREEPFDAFVSSRYESFDDMPPGAVVGTSSLRRMTQIIAQYPYLSVTALRGNLDTRLRKLDEGQYDAIVLAVAGLKRLQLAQRIRRVLPAELLLPAAGQGALGIECLSSRDDLLAMLAPLNDATTRCCVNAERVVARALGGSCRVPLGAFAQIDENEMWLRGFIAVPDGTQFIHAEVRGAAVESVQLGEQLVSELNRQGAQEIVSDWE